jgi:hypothetical protein
MAFPVTLNGTTYTLADFEGLNYVDGFPNALEDFVTEAGTKVTAAQTAQTAAETAQAAAEAALDSFDDRFLGSKASDPTLDNDGNALTDGALYFDTTNNVMKVYDLGNTEWKQTTPTSVQQTNIDTVAGISADVSTVASNDTNITTVATNIGDVNSFAEVYRIASTAPTTSLEEGDLYYNTTDNNVQVYNGSAWQDVAPIATSITASQISDVTSTAAELNLVDGSAANTITNSKAVIYGASGQITANQLDLLAQGDLRLQDSAGGQYVALQAPATISSSFTLTLPTGDGTADQVLKTDGSGNLGFVDAGGGAWNLVDEVTVSTDVSSVDLEGMDSTYQNYAVVVSNAGMSSGENVYMRFKNGGSYDTSSIYSNTSNGARSGNNNWYIQQIENQSAFRIMIISSIDTEGHGCVMYIHNPAATTVATGIHGTWMAQDGGQAYMDFFAGSYNRTTSGAVTGIRLFPNNRDWDAGNFRLYGIGG